MWIVFTVAARSDGCSVVCRIYVVFLTLPEYTSLPSPFLLSAKQLLSLLVPGQGWQGKVPETFSVYTCTDASSWCVVKCSGRSVLF